MSDEDLMRQSRRQFLVRAAGVAVLATGAGSILAACGDDDDDQDAASSTTAAGEESTSTTTGEPVKVTAMMPFAASMGYIGDMMAVTSGYFEEEGLEVDLQFARNAGQALQQLAAGQVDFIRNGVLSTIQAMADQSAPIMVVAMPNQALLYRLISTAEAPLESFADCEGKTIALPSLGGNAEEIFNQVLEGEGVDPASVTKVAAGNDAAAFAFVQDGRAAALFATVETAAVLEQQGAEIQVTDSPDANPLLGTAFVATNAIIEEQPGAVAAYIKALNRAHEALSDEATVTEVLPQLYEQWQLPAMQNPDIANAIIQAQREELWLAAGEDNMLRNVPDRWEDGVKGFQDGGDLTAEAEPEDFYTNDFVDEALG